MYINIHVNISVTGPSKIANNYRNIPKNVMTCYVKWTELRIIAMARKLAVVIHNMLARNQAFVEDHMFKSLKERKLKNMECRAKMSHEFSQEDMESIIGEIAIVSKSTKLLS